MSIGTNILLVGAELGVRSLLAADRFDEASDLLATVWFKTERSHTCSHCTARMAGMLAELLLYSNRPQLALELLGPAVDACRSIGRHDSVAPLMLLWARCLARDTHVNVTDQVSFFIEHGLSLYENLALLLATSPEGRGLPETGLPFVAPGDLEGWHQAGGDGTILARLLGGSDQAARTVAASGSRPFAFLQVIVAEHLFASKHAADAVLADPVGGWWRHWQSYDADPSLVNAVGNHSATRLSECFPPGVLMGFRLSRSSSEACRLATAMLRRRLGSECAWLNEWRDLLAARETAEGTGLAKVYASAVKRWPHDVAIWRQARDALAGGDWEEAARAAWEAVIWSYGDDYDIYSVARCAGRSLDGVLKMLPVLEACNSVNHRLAEYLQAELTRRSGDVRGSRELGERALRLYDPKPGLFSRPVLVGLHLGYYLDCELLGMPADLELFGAAAQESEWGEQRVYYWERPFYRALLLALAESVATGSGFWQVLDEAALDRSRDAKLAIRLCLDALRETSILTNYHERIAATIDGVHDGSRPRPSAIERIRELASQAVRYGRRRNSSRTL